MKMCVSTHNDIEKMRKLTKKTKTQTDKTDKLSDKIDKTIKLLKEIKNENNKEQKEIRRIKEESNKEQKEIRNRILDKLKGDENTYYLIIKVETTKPNLIQTFKAYSMSAKNWEMAYDMCSDLIDDNDEYWLLSKDEVEKLLLSIETKNISRKEKNA